MCAYRFPKYYEIAFSFRNVHKDVDFFESTIKRFSKVTVGSVLELGSGLSPHASEWHRRGYKYAGLDLSAQMITGARERAVRDGFPLRVFLRDMNSFTLPNVKVELAYLLLGPSARHRTRNSPRTSIASPKSWPAAVCTSWTAWFTLAC